MEAQTKNELITDPIYSNHLDLSKTTKTILK